MPEPWTLGPWDARSQESDSEPARVHVIEGGAWVADVFSEADARLICLAPEMAELLERIADETFYDARRLVSEAQVLLARARGESPSDAP